MADTRNMLILGSGPAGYTAALYAARARLRPLVLKGLAAGGQLMLTTEVENYPGFADGILGPELMEQMEKQAERFEAELLHQDATRVDLSGRPFGVWAGDHEYRAHSLIISTGASAKWLGIPGEDTLRGRGVRAARPATASSSGTGSWLVVGGGDTAMEEATFLTKFASKVTIVHRRDEFRASQIMHRPRHDDPKIEVRLERHRRGDPRRRRRPGRAAAGHGDRRHEEVATEGVFVAIGHTPNTALFRGSSTSRTDTSPSRSRARSRACRASSPPATSSTGSTGRRSRRPAWDARPRWTPSASWPPRASTT